MVACPLLYLCVTLVHSLVASKGPCARYCKIHVAAQHETGASDDFGILPTPISSYFFCSNETF